MTNDHTTEQQDGENSGAEKEVFERDSSLSSASDELSSAYKMGEGNEAEFSSEVENTLRQEIDERKEQYLRLMADFENYKKRTLKERAELLKYQGEQVFKDLVEVVDDLERAVEFEHSDPQKVQEGVRLIKERFLKILGKWEVRSEEALGTQFDPIKHSAISQIPSSSPDVVPNTVIGVLKKPYYYKDKLIRVGEVVVSQPSQEASSEINPSSRDDAS